VDRQVDDEGDARVEVPPVERHGERKLSWLAPVPVNDPGHKDVQRDEEQEKVRDHKSNAPCDEPGPQKLGRHPGEGPAALEQVDGHQPNEHEAHDGVVGDSYVQELKRAE